MTPQNMKDKEILAENHFKEWLDKNEVPYWYIQQDLDTFSRALKRYMSKRPDFLILTPGVGFILTDVKYKEPAKKYDQFHIDIKETQKYTNLQKYFNLQVWYVFSNPAQHFSVWYWMPASIVMDCGRVFKNRDGDEYVSVPIDKFIVLSKNDNLGRLFSEIPKFL